MRFKVFFTNFFLVVYLNFTLCYSTSKQICKYNFKRLDCSMKMLTDIPNTDEYIEKRKSAKILDLSHNAIEHLRRNKLEHLTSLTQLNLAQNDMRRIDSEAFQSLQQLNKLDLSKNFLETLEPSLFINLKNLTKLDISHNHIESLSPGVFSHLKSLKRLYINHNRLKILNSSVFQGLHNLEILYLKANKITDIPPMTFQPVVKLKYLNLNNNGLKTISANSFSHKKGLHLDILIDKNPLYCDCKFVDTVLHQRHVTWKGSCQGPKTLHERGLQNLTLNDQCRPYFTVKPQDVIVTKGHSMVKIDCSAKGDPNPYITWKHNNKPLIRDERVMMIKNGSLFLRDITRSDEGTYICTAKNSYGMVNAAADLTVLMKPIFLDTPTDKKVKVGDTVEWRCTASGMPIVTISWLKDGVPLKTGDNILIDQNNQHLTIFNVTKRDVGTYVCQGENMIEIIELAVQLRIADDVRIVVKPEKIEAFKGTSIQMPCEVESNNEVIVKWTKSGSHLQSKEKYKVSSKGSLNIYNLTINDTGLYECYVYNEDGQDTASASLTVKDYVLPEDEYVNKALVMSTKEIDEAINKTIQYYTGNNTTPLNVHELFKIARYPNTPARELARAAEIYERTLELLNNYIHKTRNITSAKRFDYHELLSRENLDLISRISGCTAHREHNNCSDICFHKKYRTVDGTCNNLIHPMWGSSLTGFRRILMPIYENGVSQPVGWNRDLKYNGYSLPSARLVSTELISTRDITKDDKITHMVMQWGQWLDHDIDHALPSVSSQTWDGVDCKKTCDYAAPCFPIDVPANDSRISNRRCIDFIRTSSVCGSGSTSAIYGQLQVREQINQLTSYIDASQVYGFEKSVADDLRDLRNDSGLLRVGITLNGSKPLLPTSGVNSMDCRRNLNESNRACFVTGDIRGNEQIGLAAMHTIWMREHNRLATELKKLNPLWDGDKIYHETRKIVGAQIQFITYEHWLPIILGPNGYEELGKYTGYDSDIDPSISNVFATAALRFGHTLINPELDRLDENFDMIDAGPLLLRNAFFSPWRLVDEGGVDPLLRGMFASRAKLKTPTQLLNTELTEHLFYSTHAVALDLAAINIQRGRDHGIPFYTEWRKVCHMKNIDNFDDLEYEISDKNVREKLKKLYGSVHNIDVWVGGILEDINEGKVGPLIKCLLIEQFKRLRNGDRFWYENPTTFQPEQLHEIKKTSLARILCDNGDNIDTIATNVFNVNEIPGGLVSCQEIPSMDLRAWIDCDSSCEFSPNEKVDYNMGSQTTQCALHERLKYTVEMNILQTEEIKQLREKVRNLESDLEQCKKI